MSVTLPVTPPLAAEPSGVIGWQSSDPAASEREQVTMPGSEAAAASTQPPIPDLSPGTAIGRYMVLGRLGAGAMGVVYAAYDPELDRKVALKLLHPRGHSSLDSRLRLMREAKALARLSHPNVVAVHDVGTYAERVFLAMEFVDGKTLGAWLKEQPQPWEQVVAVMRKAGEGLAAAHVAGLVHRDFKPDNVLIARDGRVRVLDFGLARSASETGSVEDLGPEAAMVASVSGSRRVHAELEAAQLTRTGAMVGTPAYMSPEQHLGRGADPRSDQFSFCVTLYQALYGVRPFAGERISGLAFQVLQGKIGPPPAGSAVPARVRRVVLRGLSANPDDRYDSMPALLAALDHELGFKRRGGWYFGGGALLVVGLW
ncbi:MAG: serine/threonine protein kinase, partial [Nannocystis sp.]